MSANVLLTESLGVELHSDPWPEDVTLYQTFNVSTKLRSLIKLCRDLKRYANVLYLIPTRVTNYTFYLSIVDLEMTKNAHVVRFRS